MEFTTGFELQSQATRLRWTAFTRSGSFGGKTGLSPSPVPCSKGIYPEPPPGTPGTTPRRDWQHGLFPLQSPLLRESWLVSFPPLNYMLKFSGSSCVYQVQGKAHTKKVPPTVRLERCVCVRTLPRSRSCRGRHTVRLHVRQQLVSRRF